MMTTSWVCEGVFATGHLEI